MALKNVAILISGGGSNMVALLDSMVGDHPARPCLVMANSEDAGGLAKAEARGVKTAWVDHKPYGEDRAAFEAELNTHLEAAGTDIICLAGFMRILTPAFMEKWQGRMLNIHPSLLPKYKGLNTHARALAAGDSEAGCSVHEATAELDGGPILCQARVPIAPDDDASTLAAKVLRLEHIIYPETLRRFAGGDNARRDHPIDAT
ncbi:phosphoribosylglycinamide formyltransferase [uncultured Litoreibacter sp.]|uniref:phosphoribosylglycinamide formyltransferase n=1 Tax=uncultured Litoreibacter sp. TaxID=1392394 RepID=UPI00262D99C5|nr:phosphoribosylglycinamide formyltransferase [uncultured Litoreibacter sp.]